MVLDLIMEESSRYGLITDAMDRLYGQFEKSIEDFINDYAKGHGLSFECAEYFLQKYYDFSFSVDVSDGKLTGVLVCQLKPIEEVLSILDYRSDCEDELLWG